MQDGLGDVTVHAKAVNQPPHERLVIRSCSDQREEGRGLGPYAIQASRDPHCPDYFRATRLVLRTMHVTVPQPVPDFGVRARLVPRAVALTSVLRIAAGRPLNGTAGCGRMGNADRFIL